MSADIRRKPGFNCHTKHTINFDDIQCTIIETIHFSKVINMLKTDADYAKVLRNKWFLPELAEWEGFMEEIFATAASKCIIVV